MLTLKQAIGILDLKDSDYVYLASKRFDCDAELISVRQIRNKYDMKRIAVLKIYPYHYPYSNDDNDYELIIRHIGNRKI